MERPSWLLSIPDDEYHAATKRNEYTTSHRLNLFRKCPALYKKTIDGEIVEGETEAFMLGRATHKLILEGRDAFFKEFVVDSGPINPKTGLPYGKQTKAYLEWAAAQDKPTVSTDDFALIEKMSEAVHAHPIAKGLFADGIAEGTIRTTWNGEPVQARLDWYHPTRNFLVDFKTCNDIDRLRFDIRDFGYVDQLAFYGHCVELECGKVPRCGLVAVEKKEPFRVAVVNVVELTIDDAIHHHMVNEYLRDDADAMIDELKKCRETGVWPTRYEHVIVI